MKIITVDIWFFKRAMMTNVIRESSQGYSWSAKSGDEW